MGVVDTFEQWTSNTQTINIKEKGTIPYIPYLFNLAQRYSMYYLISIDVFEPKKVKNKGHKSTKTSKVFPYYYLISIDILEPFNSVEQRAEGSKRIEGHTKTFYEVARSVFFFMS